MFESLQVLILSSVACSLIGSFLILRRLSMLADAISHSVLLGIVLAFFLAKSLNSPLLLMGATVFGVLCVALIELIGKSPKIRRDNAIGIVYPMMFSLAVILISRFAKNVHLDADMVLSGEVLFASLDTVKIFGFSAARSAIKMFVLLIIILGFIIFSYKELKLSSFDEEYAHMIGIKSGIIFYMLMAITSFTVVSAFDAIGSVLVLAFLIAPSASAYLISKRLSIMLILSVSIAIINSLLGFWLSFVFDSSIPGMCALISTLSFLLVLLFNKNGLISSKIIRIKRRHSYKLDFFILHIGRHTSLEEKSPENSLQSIPEHFNLRKSDIKKIADELISKKLLLINDGYYILSDKGQKRYAALCRELGLC